MSPSSSLVMARRRARSVGGEPTLAIEDRPVVTEPQRAFQVAVMTPVPNSERREDSVRAAGSERKGSAKTSGRMAIEDRQVTPKETPKTGGPAEEGKGVKVETPSEACPPTPQGPPQQFGPLVKTPKRRDDTSAASMSKPLFTPDQIRQMDQAVKDAPMVYGTPEQSGSRSWLNVRPGFLDQEENRMLTRMLHQQRQETEMMLDQHRQEVEVSQQRYQEDQKLKLELWKELQKLRNENSRLKEKRS